MNRIVLIGNGFDLAHGLKTSYRDFIYDYWEQTVKAFLKITLGLLKIHCLYRFICYTP